MHGQIYNLPMSIFLGDALLQKLLKSNEWGVSGKRTNGESTLPCRIRFDATSSGVESRVVHASAV